MIKEFQGEYRWLSNFWPVEIKYKERIFGSVEHAYMAQKNILDVWQDFCMNENDPKIVKKMSMEIRLRSDWEDIKVDIMEELIRIKYKNFKLRKKLLETGNEYIQEGNDWGDIFWGVDLETKKGKNIFGEIIMKVRNEIRDEQ